MKILYFHQHFSTPQGATGTRSYEMARALIEAGHEVIIVCGSFSIGNTGLKGEFKNGMRRGLVDEIEIVEFSLPYSNQDTFLKRSKVFLAFALKSVKITLKEPFDLIFATSTPLTAGIPGIIAKWVKRRPFIFEVRDLWPELPKAMGVIKNPIVLALLSFLEWVTYQTADGIIGLSPGIVEGIHKRTMGEKPILMIPNGCDSYFSTLDTTPVRPDGILKEDFIAIFTGAHGVANALHNVLYAAAELKVRERLDIYFLFIGEGKAKHDLIRLADELNLTTCMFMPAMPKHELIAYLKGANIGLMVLDNIPAFYYGTSPNKFFDYISSGLPVITNYPGWISDMINDFALGYVTAPDDPSKFADQLELALIEKDTKEFEQMGESAKTLGMNKFDRKLLSTSFVGFFEEVFNR